MVGTSGSTADRLAAVTPSARSLPALMCSIESSGQSYIMVRLAGKEGYGIGIDWDHPGR